VLKKTYNYRRTAYSGSANVVLFSKVKVVVKGKIVNKETGW
jgi:hypothetical protein